jgi:YggT family protein
MPAGISSASGALKQVEMSLLFAFFKLLTGFVILDAVLSWIIPDPSRFPRNITDRITRPVYTPIRRILRPEKTGGLDLSPLIVIVGIQMIEQLLVRLLVG